jgi:hypothetical protein
LGSVLALPDQRKALNESLTEFRAGARIAEVMEAIPPTIKQFFDQIDTSSKLYWKIWGIWVCVSMRTQNTRNTRNIVGGQAFNPQHLPQQGCNRPATFYFQRSNRGMKPPSAMV